MRCMVVELEVVINNGMVCVVQLEETLKSFCRLV